MAEAGAGALVPSDYADDRSGAASSRRHSAVPFFESDRNHRSSLFMAALPEGAIRPGSRSRRCGAIPKQGLRLSVPTWRRRLQSGERR